VGTSPSFRALHIPKVMNQSINLKPRSISIVWCVQSSMQINRAQHNKVQWQAWHYMLLQLRSIAAQQGALAGLALCVAACLAFLMCPN
jgi:hypothetical protein